MHRSTGGTFDEIRLVVADDHPIVRKGLCQVIEEQPDLKVVGEAGDGVTALALIESMRPRLAIVDLDMPKLHGFGVALEIRKLKLPVEVIFLTMHSEVDLLERAMDLGKGFVVKESALVDIVNCVRSVASGGWFVSPSMTSALMDRRGRTNALRASRPGIDDLTPAERRILGMIATGKATKEIAVELNIHPRTVESHRASICLKLELSGTNSLLRFALENKAQFL
ncbi:MAG TPA: response regulator transcription factor [Terracidiphilus sp.]|jgi:DNA-binding NarL/FixJ family response regulator